MSHWWEVSEDLPELSVGLRKLTDSNRFIVKEWGFVFKTQVEYLEYSILVYRVSTKSWK